MSQRRYRHSRQASLLGVAGLLLAGCQPEWKVEVDSNTDWYGVYGTRTGNQWSYSQIRGSGDRKIDLSNDQRVCCTFVQQADGYVHVKLVDEGGGPFGIVRESTRKGETNVTGRSVQLCSEGDAPESWLDHIRREGIPCHCDPVELAVARNGSE